MNRGLYIGATSLVNNQRKMEVLSNNLANVNTPGFKKDHSISEAFPEKLLVRLNGQNNRLMRPREDIEYENQGDYHIARSKDGYFQMSTPLGRSYVKEVRLVVDDEGYLKTSYKDLRDNKKTDYENYLLDRNGQRIQNPANIEEVLQGAVVETRDPVIGTMSGGVKFQKIFTDFSQGGLIDTGSDFDLAILGDGFFKLEGDYYTRAGSFSLKDGVLVDLDNRPVAFRGERPNFTEGQEVVIDERARVFIDGEGPYQIDIVDIENREALRKIGDNLYTSLEGFEAQEANFEGRVLQGHIETSNVNSISEMVEMISLLRDFEAGQKVIRAQDEMLEKGTTEIGRV